MIKAILFDLDGTLLNVDMDDFLNRYLQKLATHLAHFTDPQTFTKNLWASTGAMVKNTNPKMTNQEAFIEHFYTWMQHSHHEVWPYIEKFYQTVFPTLQGEAGPYPEVVRVVNELKELNCKLVLATNPIFPESAILHRLSWTGVNKDDFALITTYENMHYTKPNPKYYTEIAEMIHIDPKNCLMIGNDKEFDILPAAQAGMKTFFVDENSSGLNKNEASGRITDIPVYVRALCQ